jgi:hypothetical protein
MLKTLAGKTLGEIGARLKTSANKLLVQLAQPSQQAFLHHQQEIQYSCCMTINIRQLCFANSGTMFMKQD